MLFAIQKIIAEPGCIQGKVLDPVGAPVTSIYVDASSLDHQESIQVVTQWDGHFLIDIARAGAQYDVLASYKSNPGSAGSSGTTSVDSVRVTAVAGDRCPYLTLHQAARARLHVKATNLQTGEPIPSVQARFRVQADTTWLGGIEENGELLVPPDSNLEVQIAADGYENSQVLKIATPQPDEVHDLAVSLQPVQMGCIEGIVLDLQGSGVPGARIQTSAGFNETSSPRWASTDATGQFSIDRVQPGDYSLVTTAVGYPLTQPGSMPHLTVPSDVKCAKATIILGAKAAKLRVRVINGVTQQLINDAAILLHGDFGDQGGWSPTATGDPVPVPALTQFTVEAAAAGYVLSQLTVSPMQPEQTREITIALQPESLPYTSHAAEQQ
jgi:hypothetical protein